MSEKNVPEVGDQLTPEALFGLLLAKVGDTIRGDLMGRLLTLIDASVPESSQLSALKDLIRQEIYFHDTLVWKDLNQFARDLNIHPIKENGLVPIPHAPHPLRHIKTK